MPTDRGALVFPSNFVWGAATASYQIEGAVDEAGRGESIWDRFSHTPGKVINGDTGDIACDHFHRWRDDIGLMQQLGLQSYRFSIAWPRIQPDGRGPVNEAGLDFYDRLVDGLLGAGITPWVTLYHWDLPQALEDAGGWPARATADAFARYVDVVSRRLGDRVKHWITLNEPWCSGILGYAIGEHAPGGNDFRTGLQAVHTLLLAHGKAVSVLRANVPDAELGITLNLTHGYPASDSEADIAAARRWEGYFNRWFLDPVFGRGYPEDMVALYGADVPQAEQDDFETMAASTDFLGINFYNPAFIADAPGGDRLQIEHRRLADASYTAMDWVVYPKALEDVLLNVTRQYSPKQIFVTENGAAFDDVVTHNQDESKRVHDSRRINYYHGHLAAAANAIAQGVPLRGYFAWSLMDNFEWAFGYTKRFGLIYVDYATQERTIKDSGYWYRDAIRRNGVAEPGESVVVGDV